MRAYPQFFRSFGSAPKPPTHNRVTTTDDLSPASERPANLSSSESRWGHRQNNGVAIILAAVAIVITGIIGLWPVALLFKTLIAVGLLCVFGVGTWLLNDVVHWSKRSRIVLIATGSLMCLAIVAASVYQLVLPSGTEKQGDAKSKTVTSGHTKPPLTKPQPRRIVAAHTPAPTPTPRPVAHHQPAPSTVAPNTRPVLQAAMPTTRPMTRLTLSPSPSPTRTPAFALSVHIVSVQVTQTPGPEGGTQLVARVELFNDGASARIKGVAATLVGPTDVQRAQHANLSAEIRTIAAGINIAHTGPVTIPAHQALVKTVSSPPLTPAFVTAYQSGQAFLYVDLLFYEKRQPGYGLAQEVCIFTTGTTPQGDANFCLEE